MHILMSFMLGMIYHSFLLCFSKDWAFHQIHIFRRSHCDYCDHQLWARDLIPLISFLFCKGKCRYCQHTLPWKYPLFESLGGLLFIGIYMCHFSPTMIGGFLILEMMAMIDFHNFWVPDLLQVMLCVCIISTQPSLSHFLFAIMICALLATISFLFPQSFGGADIKCLSLLALYFSWHDFSLLLILSSLLALIYYYLSSLGKIYYSPEVYIPFVPFIAIAFYIVHIFP